MRKKIARSLNVSLTSLSKFITMSTKIKFEKEKAYKTREGKRLVLGRIEGDDMTYGFSDGYWRHADGRLIHGTENHRDIISEWTPDDEIALLKSQLAEADAKRAEAQAALDAARKAKEEAEAERVPWEPKGGGWTVTVYADVVYAESVNACRRAGAEYPTEESAKAALDRIVFFQRMCALATELNPSGKVCGRWFVYWDPSHSKWAGSVSALSNSTYALFETEEAAQRACIILNRDKWEVPAQENGVSGISLEAKG